MGNLNTITSEVVDILGTVVLSGEGAYHEIVTYPTNEFSGYPAASIVPAATPSDYITVAQNQRSYGMSVELYYPLDQNNWQTAFDTMRDLVDATMDALDQSIDLNGKCDFLRAVPMNWTIQMAGQGHVIAAEILLAAVKDVDVK